MRVTSPRLCLAAVLFAAAGVALGQPPTGKPPEPLKPAELAAMADSLEKAYSGTTPPESVRMLIAISRGSQMGPNDGWFGPAQTRYTWDWLARPYGKDSAEGITKEKFHGPESVYSRLDRDKDGRITPFDLDWSDRNPYVQMSAMVNRMFRRMDAKGDGRLSEEELMDFFKKASQGKEYLTPDDLRDALLGGMTASFSPGDGPTPEVLIRGLFRGEIGSLQEGPKVGDQAPDFGLKTHDGKKTIRLSELRGKPVVLVFGNFTCGPFRSQFPAVDEIAQRYKDDAQFVGVYVREAHPTDGWHMASNDRVVKIAQPKTYEERVGVAQQCQATLKYSMPLLVDEINDPVGNAYSGMPARLYVIDADGKVAYKSGRGPFGFKPGEMEQALNMALLERHENSNKSPKD